MNVRTNPAPVSLDGGPRSIAPFPENVRRRTERKPRPVSPALRLDERLALPDEEPDTVAVRIAAFAEEAQPRGEIGRFLARRAAVLSIRLDRSARFEAAMTSKRVREAGAAFDDERRSLVEKMGDWIAAEPATYARRLRTMPEGIDWMIAAWNGVKADLFHPTRDVWNSAHRRRIDNLMGRRPEDFPCSPVDPLCKAGWGDFSDLDDDQGGELEPVSRRKWAREQVGRLIEAEIAALEEARLEIDHAAIDRDRDEAASRALFTASPEMVLARKYEAATERGLYRALRELRDHQGPDPVDTAIDPASAFEPVQETRPPADPPARERGSLASFFPAVGPLGINPPDGPGDVGGWAPMAPARPSSAVGSIATTPYQRE